MKTLYILLTVAVLGATSAKIHSQNKPVQSSGAVLIQIKAANEALIARQTATLEVLKALQEDANQMRIVSKRG